MDVVKFICLPVAEKLSNRDNKELPYLLANYCYFDIPQQLQWIKIYAYHEGSSKITTGEIQPAVSKQVDGKIHDICTRRIKLDHFKSIYVA